MKDFLGNEINLNDNVVIAAYGEERTLRKAVVTELIEEKDYVRLDIEVDKERVYSDVLRPFYVVVVNPIQNKGKQLSLFDI